MFKTLDIIDGPIHAGKHFDFTTGTTAIVGPNGCGKSLLTEYLAFTLFGSLALRGRVSDYKGLNVVAEVIIKGKPYRIERSTSNCTIKQDGKVICLGTKPCNAKLVALLGYDYGVYKMGNYAEQLDILGLCKMKPAERKTALDRTLGIGILDKLTKYCTETALKFEHQADGIRSVMKPVPEEPVCPEGYTDKNILSSEYQMEKDALNEYRQFKAMAEPVYPELPVEPEKGRGYSIDQIQSIILRKQSRDAKISGYANLTEPKYTKEQLKGYEQSLAEWRAYEMALDRFNRTTVTCPECGAVFSPQAQKPVEPSCEHSPLTQSTISVEYVNIDRWQQREEELPQLLAETLPDFDRTTISEKVEYEKKMTAYMKDLELYEERIEAWQKLSNKFSNFDPVAAEKSINDMATLFYQIQAYDMSLIAYKKAVEENERLEEKIRESEASAEKYRTGADKIKELKTKIKGYVLPSLEKVSSILLGEMSSGLFTAISIDPDFNILVHGREVGTFSGSEQAMINLAIRLGVGQVLTHKAFNVFIGDEIDASMDSDRANLTADCLRNVSKHIRQILIVSHRDIEADQFIQLGGNDGRQRDQ